jgi:hypothetical protein
MLAGGHSSGEQRVFGMQKSAMMVGVTEGLLILWVQTGRFKPSIELAGTIPGSNEPAFGWNRFLCTDGDIERLRRLTEQTEVKKSKVESGHVKGAHYTVQELAALWGLGVDKTRELFENEPGVIKLTNPPKKGKRPSVTLRIPRMSLNVFSGGTPDAA